MLTLKTKKQRSHIKNARLEARELGNRSLTCELSDLSHRLDAGDDKSEDSISADILHKPSQEFQRLTAKATPTVPGYEHVEIRAGEYSYKRGEFGPMAETIQPITAEQITPQIAALVHAISSPPTFNPTKEQREEAMRLAVYISPTREQIRNGCQDVQYNYWQQNTWKLRIRCDALAQPVPELTERRYVRGNHGGQTEIKETG